MPTLTRRSRLVVFRLSEDEYLSLKAACERRGSRSLSDFTRSEVLGFLKSSFDDSAQAQLRVIERRLDDLSFSVSRITNLLESAGNLQSALITSFP
jgi:hypothetical protein